jgi:hypothetical protein
MDMDIGADSAVRSNHHFERLTSRPWCSGNTQSIITMSLLNLDWVRGSTPRGRMLLESYFFGFFSSSRAIVVYFSRSFSFLQVLTLLPPQDGTNRDAVSMNIFPWDAGCGMWGTT